MKIKYFDRAKSELIILSIEAVADVIDVIFDDGLTVTVNTDAVCIHSGDKVVGGLDYSELLWRIGYCRCLEIAQSGPSNGP